VRFFYKPLFRIVPDGTRIHFMRGRFAGLIVSAVLSLASLGLFFYPGLRLGIDFKGGVVMEVRTPSRQASRRCGPPSRGMTCPMQGSRASAATTRS